KGGVVLTLAPPPKPAARSRLIIGEFGPSDSALAAARGGRLRRPAADRHAARCASRALCSGVRPLALYALEGTTQLFFLLRGGCQILRCLWQAPFFQRQESR